MAGLLRFEWAYGLGWAIQVAAIALGFVIPMMFVLGAIFVVLWATAYFLGPQIETRAGRVGGHGNPPGTPARLVPDSGQPAPDVVEHHVERGVALLDRGRGAGAVHSGGSRTRARPTSRRSSAPSRPSGESAPGRDEFVEHLAEQDVGVASSASSLVPSSVDGRRRR